MATAAASTADDPPADGAFFCRVFDAEGHSRAVALEVLAQCCPGDDALAWVDLGDAPAAMLDAVWQAWELPAAARAFVDGGTAPEMGQEGGHFWVRVIVAGGSGNREKLAGSVLSCITGDNRVVTFHRQPIDFVEDMRGRQWGNGALGVLCAESFVATLLDRQLASYFTAINDYEIAIERLEVRILGERARDMLPELQRLRRWASRLRRMLAPHRRVFGALSRPDFRPDENRTAERHFVALDTRFERAMDMVENARELVLGSFELFSNQTALRTNDAMRVLTFVTVVTGLLATIVGALGMNFRAGFFKTDDVGFFAVVGGLLLLAAGAFLLGRHRRWF